jgi:hypothetical protein
MQALLRLAAIQRQDAVWERGPELTMILLHSPDKSSHMTWNAIQSAQWEPVDEALLLRLADVWDGPVHHDQPFPWSHVPDPYLEIDAWLGELLEVMPYDYVVLVSDHGMTRRMQGAGLVGVHDPDHPEAHDGILAIYGPGIASGLRLGRVSVLDFAPTVAHLLGLPVADGLPGDVLTQAFTAEYRQFFPVETIDRW